MSMHHFHSFLFIVQLSTDNEKSLKHSKQTVHAYVAGCILKPSLQAVSLVWGFARVSSHLFGVSREYLLTCLGYRPSIFLLVWVSREYLLTCLGFCASIFSLVWGIARISSHLFGVLREYLLTCLGFRASIFSLVWGYARVSSHLFGVSREYLLTCLGFRASIFSLVWGFAPVSSRLFGVSREYLGTFLRPNLLAGWQIAAPPPRNSRETGQTSD